MGDLGRSSRLLRVVLTLVLTAGVMSVLALRPSPAFAAADPVIGAAGDIACDPTSAVYNGGNGTGTDCIAKATAARAGPCRATTMAGSRPLLSNGSAERRCAWRF